MDGILGLWVWKWRLQMALDPLEQTLAQFVLLQEMAEVQDRSGEARPIWPRSTA